MSRGRNLFSTYSRFKVEVGFTFLLFEIFAIRIFCKFWPFSQRFLYIKGLQFLATKHFARKKLTCSQKVNYAWSNNSPIFLKCYELATYIPFQLGCFDLYKCNITFSQTFRNFSRSKGPFLRTRDNNYRSGILWFHFKVQCLQCISKLFWEGVSELGPGKFFIGKRDLSHRQNPLGPKIWRKLKVIKT